MLYKNWFKEWLECYEKFGIKERTYEHYIYIAERYVLQAIGDYDLTELTHNVLQRFIISLTEKTNNHKALSTNTIKTVWRLVNSTLISAKEENKVDDAKVHAEAVVEAEANKAQAATEARQKIIEENENVQNAIRQTRKDNKFRLAPKGIWCSFNALSRTAIRRNVCFKMGRY